MCLCEYSIHSTKSIALKFSCTECNEEIEETLENLPLPNLNVERETHSATLNDELFEIECPKCSKTYSVTAYASIDGGTLDSDDLPEDTEVCIEEFNDYFDDYSEAVESNTEFFETFYNQMEKIKKLSENDILNEELIDTLDKLLFSNMITCLETYLSDALINTISTNEIFVKNFVENFTEYKKCSFKFNEIYKKMDNIEKKVKEDLLSLMYHNLDKIKAIYKITFNIDFPDITNLMKKVNIRHDLVHRNGKNKNGREHTISKTELNETYYLVLEFVKNIDEQLTATKENLFQAA